MAASALSCHVHVGRLEPVGDKARLVYAASTQAHMCTEVLSSDEGMVTLTLPPSCDYQT
jgi:hypothetical protein